MTGPTTRKATLIDIEEIGACLEAAYADYVQRIEDLPPVTVVSAEDVTTQQVWVAESEGSVAGALFLDPRDGFMLLANIAVHPDHAGAGLGKELLALAETEAARQGYTQMRLNTHADMHETIGYYLRRGWIKTGRQGNKVSMSRELVA